MRYLGVHQKSFAIQISRKSTRLLQVGTIKWEQIQMGTSGRFYILTNITSKGHLNGNFVTILIITIVTKTISYKISTLKRCLDAANSLLTVGIDSSPPQLTSLGQFYADFHT